MENCQETPPKVCFCKGKRKLIYKVKSNERLKTYLSSNKREKMYLKYIQRRILLFFVEGKGSLSMK